MTYRCGSDGSLAAWGIEAGPPKIICDSCGVVRHVLSSRGVAPVWFMDGKAAPGWKMTRIDDGARRLDWCPKCKSEPGTRFRDGEWIK